MLGLFSKFRNLISSLPKSRLIFILGGLILLLAIPLTVFVAQQQQKTKQHASFTSPASNFSSFTKDYQQLIAEKAIDPAREILEVSLSYDESKDPRVSVSETRILNGYVPSQFENLSPNAYTLQELDNYSRVLYKIRFEIPNDVHVDPNPDGTITAPVHTELKQVDFIQTIPYLSAANSIMIFDPQGKTIAVKFLKDTPKIDNQPNFKLINGEDIVRLSETGTNNPGMGVPKLNMNNLLPSLDKAFAQETVKKKINIAFIGDGSQNYEKDVQAASDYLFALEPFHTRASQFNIVYINEDSYIKKTCLPTNCDIKGLVKEANNKGLPYDMITIVLPDRRAFNGVLGATIVYRTDDKLSPSAWVHELGHVLVRLHDEYVSPYSGQLDPLFAAKITNQILENCYGGTPPSSAWANLVGAEDYLKGCTSEHLYRTSSYSIMEAHYFPNRFFNAVSQKAINETIDKIAGPYTEDKTPPQVQFESLALENQELKVKALATDNKGVAYVQFWVDGVFLKTAYISPYEFVLDTSSLKENEKHTLYFKAYDASGNVGQAKKEYALVDKSPAILSHRFKVVFNSALVDKGIVDTSNYITIYVKDEVTNRQVDVGVIKKIEPFVDDRLRQLTSAFNGSYALFAVVPEEYPSGYHNFYAKAYDFAGNMYISDTITFNIVNSNFGISSPVLTPFPISAHSQRIKSIPPAPISNKKINGKGILAGYVFLTGATVISDDKISCAMYIFLKDSMGNEVRRLSVPVSKDMGRQAYKFDNLDTSKDYVMTPAFYGCDGGTLPPESFKSRKEFENLIYTGFQDFIITYLSDTIPIPTPALFLNPTLYDQCIEICGQNNSDCIQKCDNLYKQPSPTSAVVQSPFSAPTPTSVPAAVSPTVPTNIPTTVISTVPTFADLRSLGDADGDGIINNDDIYTWWAGEINGVFKTKKSDFDGNGIVNTDDYNIWRDSMNNPNLPH